MDDLPQQQPRSADGAPAGYRSGGDGRGQNAGDRLRRLRMQGQSLESLFERSPPHSLEAEMTLLGSILLDPSVMADVLTHVGQPEDFYSEVHRSIFAAIKAIYERDAAADIVEIAEHLRDRNELEAVGGGGYIVSLAEAVPSPKSAARYAKIVADKAKLRQLIDAAGEIVYNAYNVGEIFDDASDILDDAESKIFKIASQRTSDRTHHLASLLEEEMARVEAAMERGGVLPGLKTGFKDLDETLAGLHNGELVIVAARPSMGKTALALNIAEQLSFGGRDPWAPKAKKYEPQPIAFFSLEMSREGLTQRFISARSGIAGDKLRKGEVRADEWQTLLDACAELSEAPLYIDDTPGMTVLQLRARARRLKDRLDIKAIVIDYLQLLTSPGSARESRQVEVSSISRQIKALARELEIPVVCLAQLNRAAEQRTDHRPRMSDLRESGSIEQDADVIILLHREAYHHRGDPAWDPTSGQFDEMNRDKLNTAELIVAKQRNGPTGTVRLTWDESITRFKDRDGRHDGFDDYGGGGFAGSASGFVESPPTGGQPYPPAQPTQHAQPHAPPQAASPAPDYHRPAFTAAPPSGPVADHRDGGGPDRDAPPAADPSRYLPPDEEDEDGLPPF